jgi:hypothetical protein
MPVTPQNQRPSKTHPEPQLAQPPKRRSRAPQKKVSRSTTSHDDALLPLPPPATPSKTTLSVTLDSDLLSDRSHNPFESSPPKKAHSRKAKRRPQHSEDIVRSDPPAIPALNVSQLTVDDDDESGKL